MSFQLQIQESDSCTLLHADGLPRHLLDRWRELLLGWEEGKPLAGARALNQGEVYRLGDDAGAVVFKRSWQLGWRGLALRLGARRSPLERAFRLGLAACRAGLCTPLPLAYFQRRVARGFETVLVTRFIPGTPPWRFLQDNPVRKQHLFALLGHEIASWHARGFRHRDLKGPNLLYCEADDTLHLLDLDGAHRVSQPPALPVRAQDLGRLKASALSGGLDEDDWENLLSCYLDACRELGIAIERPQSFRAAIERRALRKVLRNRQKHRPLA